MKKYILKICIALIGCYCNTLQAQVTIDYSTYSASGCNIFGLGANVNGIPHQTTFGQPEFNSNNKSVKLAYNNTSGQKGTEYKIAYNFKQYYTYKFTFIERNATNSTIYLATGLKIAIGDNGSSNSCNGPELITNISGGSNGFFPVNNVGFTSAQYIFTEPLSSASNYFRISTYSDNQPNPTSQTIEIQKIIIEETAPTPNFTITPATLTIPCGSTTAVTFVSNNVYNTSGVSSYQWAVGNGWSLLDGTPVSGTIYTYAPINNISLKPNTILPPSNVTVVPIIGFFGFQSPKTSFVSLAPFTSSATMTGPSLFCTSSNFSLSGVLANQTVTWSLSNTTAATLSVTTGTSITVASTTVGGDVTLNARISNACGQFYDVTKNLSIGVNAIFAVLTTPSGNPYIYPYTNAPEGCNVPFYCFTTSSATVNATDTSRQIKFVCNGITVIKQPAAFANAQIFLYASDFGIAEGQSFTVSAFYGNSCGFVARPRVFTLYRPTQCQCGIGVGCLQLPRAGGLVASEVFNAQAYPNPFASHFTLDIESSSDLPVDIKVYDMIGRQLEVRKATVSELSSLEIGRNYPVGLYNLLFSQGDKVKSLRMVKR